MKFRKRKRASLTIEAAMILPVFLAGLLTLVSVLPMTLVSQRIQASLANAARRLAVECAGGRSATVSYITDMVLEDLGNEDFKYIKGGRDGIDMSRSRIEGGEYMELSLDCSFVPLTDIIFVASVPYSRKILVHVWSGYDKGMFSDDEYVYITKNSEVYHRNRECSHITLSVTETSGSEVVSKRNESGGRYRPCELCKSKLSDEKLFITDDGDRFHNKATCSGLKRTVYAVRLSEAGGRRPCSRCGR